MILRPGDPGFYETLAAPPPGWRSQVSSANNATFIVRADGSGLLELVNNSQFTEYVEGGEYEQRLLEFDDDEDVINFDL